MKQSHTPDMFNQYPEFTQVNLPADWTHHEHDIRNETLEEIASAIDMMPFGDTAASFAVWIRSRKSGPKP